MDIKVESLFDDEFSEEPPAKRALAYIQSKRENGNPITGIYCSYAPMELMHAMDIVPAVLCAFANKPIEAAEEVLPANLCPLVKSSYGFIVTDTCPFFALSDAVIAETTCDGKKKMFELISDRKPLFVMDLPQVPDREKARGNWTATIRNLQLFLEEKFDRTVTDDKIEEAIRDINRRNELMRKIFGYSALNPPIISWAEMYSITFLAMIATGKDVEPFLKSIIKKLGKRVEDGYSYGKTGAPRVLVTGCPIGGDSAKIYKIIEEAGGIIIAQDSCTGMKPFMDTAEEGTGDPVRAIAEKYLKIPCSCMTPNSRRLDAIDNLVDKFKPDVVVDFVLHACHTYNVESHRVGKFIKEKHGLPFMKIVSDYSDGDIEQIRTRVEALLGIIDGMENWKSEEFAPNC